ncbi:MAG: imidazole glycerol phosphate synthase subunit HisH [Bacteroidia bacterium]
MKVVIIKYNSGNVRSVKFALERIGVSPLISDDADEIRSADKIILPGVGEASSAMKYLKENELDKVIVSLTQPILGICLGMQLMCRYSEEGNTDCLGIFNQQVKKFDDKLKVPQIGWNDISNLKTDLFKNITKNEFVYFVHGYYAELSENTIATTNYGIDYSSALQKNNFYGVQFHPEKSGIVGEKILKNFVTL